MYWSNNLRLWILLISLVNLVIMAQRIYYYSDLTMVNGFSPNFFALAARSCGKALIFNSALVLVLVLRKTITSMARIGMSGILPLEHHIYVHKVTGILIFLQATVHTIAHLCNFAINVQPNPIVSICNLWLVLLCPNAWNRTSSFNSQDADVLVS